MEKIVIIGTNDHIYSADTFTATGVPNREVFFTVNWTDLGYSGLEEVAFSKRHIFLVQSGKILCLPDYTGVYTHSNGVSVPATWGTFPRHGGYYDDKPVTAISFDGYQAELAIIQDGTVIYADNIANWTANWRTISGNGFSRVSLSNGQCVGLVGNQLYYNPNCADANWYKVNDSSDLTEISFDGYKMTLLCIRSGLIDVYYADKMNIIEYENGNMGITPNWELRYGTPDHIHTSKISHSNGQYIAIDKTNRIFFNTDAKGKTRQVYEVVGQGIRPSFDGYNGQLPSLEDQGWSRSENTKSDNTNYPHYDGNPNFQFKGCWKGYGPGNWRSLYRSSSEGIMTAKECRDEAIRNKVRFFSLQNGGNCYLENDNLQNFNEDFDYEKYGAGFTSLCSSSKDGAQKDTYRYGSIRADHVYRALTAQEQNRHEENSASVDYNTQSDNLNYPNKDTSLPNQYNYRGCWADDNWRTRGSNNLGVTSTAKQCRDLAYNNGNINFELYSGGYCFGSNTSAYNTEAKGFTDRCQNLFGGHNTNQVYELKFTKADEDRVKGELTTILNSVKAKDVLIRAINLEVLNIVRAIDGPEDPSGDGILMNGLGYANQAFTAVSNGNSNMTLATTNSNNAFNFSAIALQNAETARRLSQDLTKQREASQMAQNAQDNSNNSIDSANLAYGNISSANANYGIVISKANAAIDESANVNTSLANARGYLDQAITEYQLHFTSSNYKSYIDTTAITAIKTEIEGYIGVTNSTIQGTSMIQINETWKYITNYIDPLIVKIRAYKTTASDQTERNQINEILSQSTTAAGIANTNANDVQASTKSQIARLSFLDTIKKQQESQLAIADAAQAQLIQSEIDEAEAKKSRLNLESSMARATKAQLAYDRSLVQINTINKQNSLMDRLNTNILNINNLTTIEGFANPLPTTNNQEINNYVKTFNNGLALFDDPNQMTKVAFDTYLHIQDNKLAKLNEDLNNLKEKASTSNASPIKSIRSMNNSAILNLESYPDKDTTKNNPKYLIYGNNGCLQYENQYEENPNTWNFKPCDANKAKQQFKITQINTLKQYNDPITNNNNKNYKIKSQSNTKLGFYTVNPIDDFDQCLQLNNDGVSVMPCNMDSSQKFSVKYNNVL